MFAPACRSILPPALIEMSPPRTPAAPGAASVPLTVTSPSATIRMRPSFATMLVAEEMPFAFTTSVKSGALPRNRAPAYSVPPTLITPADRLMPSIAFTLPWIEIRPAALRGAVPFSSCVTDTSSGEPGPTKKLLTNCWVGVETFRLPTLTTPPLPTMKPFGLANQMLPPMRPSLIAFRMPSILVRSSRTMLMRLAVPEGR